VSSANESQKLCFALFSLLAVAESLDVDAGDALDESLAEYEERIEGAGSASSDG
jgi:hypothetical protein